MALTSVNPVRFTPPQSPAKMWVLVSSISLIILGIVLNVTPRWYLGSWYSRDIGDVLNIIGAVVFGWMLPSWVGSKINHKYHSATLLFARLFLIAVILTIVLMWSYGKACQSGSCI